MNLIKTNFPILFLVLMVVACSPAQDNKKRNKISHYDLSHPNFVLELPYDLQEVSGLSLVNDSTIAMVQDERGILFLYNLNQKEVVRKIKFGKDGDYEGVEIVNETVFVMESNGDLTQFNLNSKDKPKKVKTQLSSKNNVEGLGYSRNTHQLLIACKGSPSIKGLDYKGRAVYRYDLNQKRLETPPMTIKKSMIEAYVQKQSISAKIKEFRPSAVARHPIDSHVYILAHGGKLLLGIDSVGEIQYLEKLKGDLFYQPEGLCFAQNGDMYIANEGGKGRGTLSKFKYNPN